MSWHEKSPGIYEPWIEVLSNHGIPGKLDDYYGCTVDWKFHRPLNAPGVAISQWICESKRLTQGGTIIGTRYCISKE